MRFPFTIFFTLFGLALSLYNYTGYDPHNVFFFMFSIPVWFTEFFVDIHDVNVWLMYALTILSYALIGYLTDLGIRRLRTWKHM